MPGVVVPRLSFRQYAKYRGVSAQAVTKAVQKGRITPVLDENGRRWIDPEKADLQWDSNSAPEKKTTPTRAEAGNAPETAQNQPFQAPFEGNSEANAAGAIPAYARSKAMRESFAARLAGLEYQERLGKLVSADKVRIDAFNTARMVREAILNIPDRVADVLAAEKDPRKVHLRLTQELIQALEELSRGKT